MKRKEIIALYIVAYTLATATIAGMVSCSFHISKKLSDKLKKELESKNKYEISSTYVVDLPNGEKNIFVKLDRFYYNCNAYDPQTNIIYDIPNIDYSTTDNEKLDLNYSSPVESYLTEEEIETGYLTKEDIEEIESRLNENKESKGKVLTYRR